MNNRNLVMVMGECVVRYREGSHIVLMWIGAANDPRKAAVERSNAGHATEEDFLALETVPVFDEDAPDKTEIISEIRR